MTDLDKAVIELLHKLKIEKTALWKILNGKDKNEINNFTHTHNSMYVSRCWGKSRVQELYRQASNLHKNNWITTKHK